MRNHIERLVVKLFWNIAPVRKLIQRFYPRLHDVLTMDEFTEKYIRPAIQSLLDAPQPQ